ncbi:MAG: S1 RNA-binding domain-containing protein, partial [Patescibacteria group bacterium]
ATTLSLMDAGVPLKQPVAGIAMGLMSDDKGRYKVLTDIQGPEDHYGDMDFKAAGTRNGVTAIQMDVKITGVTPSMVGEVLEQAKAARFKILDVMDKILSSPREKVSDYAPVIMTISIPKDKIGEVIGPGGKVINGIIERTGALSIDIEEDGQVFVTAIGHEKAQAAYDAVASIVKVYAIGDIVEGTVSRLLEFGAIVDFGNGRDGMIHVSELKAGGFVNKVEDVVKEGDFVRAKVIRVEGGKIGLSLKAMSETTPRPPEEGGGDRRHHSDRRPRRS